MATNENSKYSLAVNEVAEYTLAVNEGTELQLAITEGTQLQLSLNGPTGAIGPANVLGIGNVTTAETGINASATITGTSPTQTLNLTLPKGNTGTAATIAVGNTTTSSAGSSASVSNSGTSGAAIFNFTIPRGDTGANGIDGVDGATGPANILSVSGTTTGLAGTSANVTISGTSPTQSLAFTIPRGDKGDTGATGAAGPTGQSSSYYPYLAKTTANSGDPASTFLLWNNATQRSSTQINVSHITSDSSDVDVFLALLKVSDFVIIQSRSNSDNFQKWQISSATTITPNLYIQIPVTYVDSGGTGYSNFSSNEQIIFIFVATGATGPTGPANTLAIGTVAAGGIGVANATITGTAPNQTLNLTLPTGATGSAGAAGANGAAGVAATVSAGNTTTGSAGSSASVSNSGNTSAAVFEFTIPRGNTGDTGPIGPSIESLIITEATTARTLVLADTNQYIRCTNVDQTTITVPLESSVAWTAGAVVYFRRDTTAGAIQLAGASGVTINNFATAATVLADNNFAIKKIGTDIWDFI